ncbi:MAG: DUF305 domain-containing protein [Lachnospiraceae bacterium]|nr:DUF305 domain-containing protein [Lachnospiraceae bacterium]
MSNSNNFSRNTQTYLDTFSCILDDMIKGMTCAELNNSISHNFIVQMIPHHRAAIKMSENILKYTTNLTIESIACNIIEEQTKSISNMENILSCCSAQRNSDKSVCEYQNAVEEISNTMFCRMRDAEAVNSVNCNFLREMIPHHKGAVKLCENAQEYRLCPELEPIIDSIITSQKQGICQMEELLERLS